MVRPEVVAYLEEHHKKFKLTELRKHLESEGISSADFDDSLKAARHAQKRARRRAMGRFLMIFGILCCAGAGLMMVLSKKPAPPPAPVVSTDKGFVGKSGYVIGLPDGYTAVQSSDPADPQAEIVYFCRAGTDPSSLIDSGLFGQLGIVRLDARPNPFGDGLTGLSALTEYETNRAQRGGDKYALKNIQVASLFGIQLSFEAPNARVETYIIGQHSLYSFYAGQDDELLRGLVNSLRDTQEE